MARKARNSISERASGTVAAPTAAVRHWVECDGCHKWRSLPAFVNVEELTTKKWYCEDNIWDNIYNNCDVPEENWQAAPDPNAGLSAENAGVSGAPGPGATDGADEAHSDEEMDDSKDAPSETQGYISGKSLGNPQQSGSQSRGGTKGKLSKRSADDIGSPDPSMRDARISSGKTGRASGIKEKKKKIIESQWVQCEQCNKWRKLAPNMSTVELPKGAWTCKLNYWDLDRASCDAPEETVESNEVQLDAEGRLPSQFGASSSGSHGACYGSGLEVGQYDGAMGQEESDGEGQVKGGVKRGRRASLEEIESTSRGRKPRRVDAEGEISSQQNYSTQVATLPRYFTGIHDFHAFLVLYPVELWADPSSGNGIHADAIRSAYSVSIAAGAATNVVPVIRSAFSDFSSTQWFGLGGRPHASRIPSAAKSSLVLESFLRWGKSSQHVPGPAAGERIVGKKLLGGLIAPSVVSSIVDQSISALNESGTPKKFGTLDYIYNSGDVDGKSIYSRELDMDLSSLVSTLTEYHLSQQQRQVEHLRSNVSISTHRALFSSPDTPIPMPCSPPLLPSITNHPTITPHSHLSYSSPFGYFSASRSMFSTNPQVDQSLLHLWTGTPERQLNSGVIRQDWKQALSSIPPFASSRTRVSAFDIVAAAVNDSARWSATSRSLADASDVANSAVSTLIGECDILLRKKRKERARLAGRAEYGGGDASQSNVHVPDEEGDAYNEKDEDNEDHEDEENQERIKLIQFGSNIAGTNGSLLKPSFTSFVLADNAEYRANVSILLALTVLYHSYKESNSKKKTDESSSGLKLNQSSTSQTFSLGVLRGTNPIVISSVLFSDSSSPVTLQTTLTSTATNGPLSTAARLRNLVNLGILEVEEEMCGSAGTSWTSDSTIELGVNSVFSLKSSSYEKIMSHLNSDSAVSGSKPSYCGKILILNLVSAIRVFLTDIAAVSIIEKSRSASTQQSIDSTASFALPPGVRKPWKLDF